MHVKYLKSGDIAKKLTLNVKVTGVNVLIFRVRVACVIIRLAALIAGVGVRIDTGQQSEQAK